MSMQFKNTHFDIKSLKDDGSFSGYASLFDETDSYGDRTMPGCFKKSLRRHKKAGHMPPMLWQHRSDYPIGTWPVMREDKTGLFVEGQLELEVKKAREAHALLKSGAISGLSIGFRTVNSVWNKVDHVRELIDVDLWEVSLVTFPALTSARVGDVKHADLHESLKQLDEAIAISSARLALASV